MKLLTAILALAIPFADAAVFDLQQHLDIAITGNVIADSPSPNLLVVSTNVLLIRNNRIAPGMIAVPQCDHTDVQDK